MLEIKNLHLYLKQDFRDLIKDFSFSVHEKGQKIALIGEEGNGKSTLLKAIYDPSLISSYVDMNGQINNKGEVISYLPQIIGDNWGNASANELIDREIGWQYLDYNLYYELLNQLNLDDQVIAQNTKALHLSGGEKVKFSLILALLKRPSLLLLDEPSNDLDLDSIRCLERLILDLDIPIIYVSHDEELLRNTANTIIHFEQLVHKTIAKHNIFVGDYDTYVRKREESIMLQNQQYKNDQARFQEKQARHQQIFERVQHELRTVSRQAPSEAKGLKVKMRSLKSQGKRYEKEKSNLTQKRIVEESINLKFDPNIEVAGGKEILNFHLDELRVGSRVLSKDISLVMSGSDKVCLIGPNGSGKTSLLRLIRQDIESRNLKVAFMPQSYDEDLDLKRSPVNFLTRFYTKEEHTKIRTYLGSLNFTKEEMLRPIASLSGGQKAKLYFAKMIFEEAEFLILDEPSRNLSPLSAPELRQALKDFSGPILSVSHDRAFIREVFDRVYSLNHDGLKLIFKEDL